MKILLLWPSEAILLLISGSDPVAKWEISQSKHSSQKWLRLQIVIFLEENAIRDGGGTAQCARRHFRTKLMSQYIGSGQNNRFDVRIRELVSKVQNLGGKKLFYSQFLGVFDFRLIA